MQLSDDERIVEGWLRDHGYPKLQYEPAIVTTGRKPDFLAVAKNGIEPSTVWAEVKSIGPEDTIFALNRAWPTLKELGVPEKINGHAMLHATQATREQSVRAIVKLFHTKAANFANEKRCLIFVQQESDKKDIKRIDVQSNVPQTVWVRGAGNARVVVPNGVIEDGSAIAAWESDGTTRSSPAFTVFDWQLPFDCALIAHIDPTSRPLTSISSMSGGTSSAKNRALSAIESANSQLRNASKFEPAPGIVFLFLEELTDDGAVTAALYGDLTVSFDPNTHKLGDAFHGHNGALRSNKNTHISGVIRLHRKSGVPATYFPNPFARYPIAEDAPLLAGAQRANVKFV
jgi:hypothetical protein